MLFIASRCSQSLRSKMDSRDSTCLLFLIAVALCYGPAIASTAKLPNTFLRCKQLETENECVKVAIEKALKAMKNGIPSLQLLPIDPLAVTKLHIEEGAGQPINVKMDIMNAHLSGLYGVQVEGAKYNLSQRIFDVDVILPFLTLNGDYVMDGRFLLLPLRGKGKCSLTLSNFKTNFVLKASPIKKNKDIYWHVTSVTLKIHSVSNFKVQFDNLFNGDKTLGQSTNKVLNDNWEEFWGVLRPSMEVAFGNIFASVANVIFSRVPEKDIFVQ